MSINMMLSTKPNGKTSDVGSDTRPTGQSIANFLVSTHSKEDFFDIYKSYFNSYSYHLTISPKSTPLFVKPINECRRCGRGDKKDVDDYLKIFKNLFSQLINMFSIDILITYEPYSNNEGIHCHCILNTEFKQIKLIKSFLSTYLKVPIDGPCIKINEIKSYTKYMEYMTKTNYNNDVPYMYFISPHKKEVKINDKKKKVEKIIKLRKKINNDEYTEHFIDCGRDKCRLCDICKNVMTEEQYLYCLQLRALNL